MEIYIEQINDDFGLLEDGRVIAVCESFAAAKLLQLMTFLRELTQ